MLTAWEWRRLWRELSGPFTSSPGRDRTGNVQIIATITIPHNSVADPDQLGSTSFCLIQILL
jgi:hypothetical protein